MTVPRQAQSVTRQVKARDLRIAREANAAHALAGIQRGMEVLCLTHGQFSLLDAVTALLDVTGPAHVDIATWTAAAADLTRAEQFLRDGRLLSLRFVVDTSFPQRQPGYARQLVDLFGENAIRTTRTHAKWATIRTPDDDGWRIAIRTSMNLNDNPRLEYLEVSDDPAVCGLLVGATDDIFATEKPGDYATKSRPALATVGTIPGVTDVRPATAVRTGFVTL